MSAGTELRNALNSIRDKMAKSVFLTKNSTKSQAQIQEWDMKARSLVNFEWMFQRYSSPLGIDDIDEFQKHTLSFVEGYDPNELFDSDWYLRENIDVAIAEIDPLYHYVNFGEKEGRRPNPFFDPILYSNTSPGLAEAWNGPLLSHYIYFGKSEGRVCGPIQATKSLHGSISLAKQNIEYVSTLLNGSKVALVIPVFNNWTYTERCLRSISESIDFELVQIIVINDSSTDDTVTNLLRYPFVEVISTPENLGFTRACNFAFEQLHEYEFIYLLNNDTEVLSGFIVNSFEVMHRDVSAGIVGSRLLYDDGSLQEVGGIVFQDGSACNFGRNGNADRAIFGITRKVDYCSGAALLVRNSCLKEVGGFDLAFAPAYYEDTDLSFQFRKIGFSTYVASESNVVHHEGKTHGVDNSDYGKSFQTVNRTKFHSKWKFELEAHHDSQTNSIFEAAFRLSPNKFSILWVDSELPDGTRDSGSVRATALMEIALELGCRIIFVCPNSIDGVLASRLKNKGIGVCKSIDSAINEFGSDFDIAWISRAPVMKHFLNDIRFKLPTCKILFDTVDLHGLRMLREVRHAISGNFDGIAANRMIRDELFFAKSADAIIVVSEYERQWLHDIDHQIAANVVSNIHDPSDEIPEFDATKGMVFIGGFNHPPNISAVEWFVDSVWPLLSPSIRDEGLTIVGSNMPLKIQKYKSSQIQPIGWVLDSTSVIKQHRISIAPLLWGAGVKGKVGESMSAGVPMVLTDVASEGMGIIHEKHALVANDPNEFAKMIEMLYENQLLWNSLQAEAVDLIRVKFSRENAKFELLKIFTELSPQYVDVL
jgi:GT2 family glycosyltransferase